MKVTIKKLKPDFTDARGSITDIINEKVSHVGIITTAKGAVRANHYHKLSTQYNYILSGSFEVTVADAKTPQKFKKHILNEGDLMTIHPMTIHQFKALKKTVMLDIISQSRANNAYEKDVYRMPDIFNKSK
ncbi:cupin domain-containing protein [Candidatus Parcubacteria bacterium]|nr:cupin domain-containing protein [Candidatus Parcubacteria bacterium]